MKNSIGTGKSCSRSRGLQGSCHPLDTSQWSLQSDVVCLRQQIHEKGFVVLDYPGDSLEAAIAALANCLGSPARMRSQNHVVEKLKVVKKQDAHPASLSRLHGEAEFPLHTDTAHWQRPCRYLLLACKVAGRPGRPTSLLPMSSMRFSVEQMQLIASAPFRIKNGRSSFYGHIMKRGQKFWRFDQGCMMPSNSVAMNALKSVLRQLAKATPIHIDWRANQIAVIDNWNVLHGRGASPIEQIPRELLRVLVQ